MLAATFRESAVVRERAVVFGVRPDEPVQVDSFALEDLCAGSRYRADAERSRSVKSASADCHRADAVR